MLKRICAMFCVVLLLFSFAGTACTVFAVEETAADTITVEVESFEDYTTSWGRDAIGITFCFSVPFTTAPMWTYISDEYDDYITINGVVLSDRRTNPGAYEVDANYSYAAASIQPDAEPNQMIIQMQGGGISFPSLSETVVVSFSKDMPMAEGTLGRDITMVYNAETDAWTEEECTVKGRSLGGKQQRYPLLRG